MAAKTGSQAPSSVADGLNGIVSAISAAMTAPDAGPHLPLFEQLLKATVGAIQKGSQPQGPPQGGPPGGAPPGGPGGPMAGGLPGMGGGGPSAGPQGGPSPSGASADDIRRMVGAQAGTAG